LGAAPKSAVSAASSPGAAEFRTPRARSRGCLTLVKLRLLVQAESQACRRPCLGRRFVPPPDRGCLRCQSRVDREEPSWRLARVGDGVSGCGPRSLSDHCSFWLPWSWLESRQIQVSSRPEFVPF